MDQINFFKCLADETRFNIVMLVLGNNEPGDCSDVNGDGTLNVLDIVLLVNIVLG